MLYVSRRVGEQIMIGDNIILTVVRFSNNGQSVRLAVEAPHDVPIFRDELLAPSPTPQIDAGLRLAEDT